ncbi:hypothetical protein GQ42DRAFT_170414 [Ramicandelaber brevisporus]|nr:hypothetical protein GQ42DRAFT_170414 [Ramicandelaber brevisporus]
MSTPHPSAYPPVSTYVFTHPGTAQATVENALEILISPKYNSRTLSNNYALVKIGGAGSDAMKLSTTIKLQSSASVMAKGTEVVNIGCDANDNCESVKRRIVDGERCKAAGTESGSSSLCTTSTVEAVSPPSPQCIANSGIEPSDLLVYTDPSTKKPALVGIASYSTTAFSQSSSASPLLPKSTCGSDADRLLHYTSIESIINDIAQQLGTTAEVLTASAESTDHSNTTTTAKPTSANEDDSGSTSGGGSSNGLAIGFGIGGGVLVLAGIALIFYYRRMERHRGYQRERLAQFTIVPASVDRLSSASTASVTAMSPSLLNVKSMASSTPRYAMRATPYSSYA